MIRAWVDDGSRPASRKSWTNAYTAMYVHAKNGGYDAYAEELLGVRAWGESLEEAERNLRGAIVLYLESNRRITRKAYAGARIFARRPITVSIKPRDFATCRPCGEA